MSVISSSDLVGSAPGGRKLIAMVYADMVGYSRLIELDDIGTLERLRTLRGTLIDPAINEHGGRIVQTGGDSLLVVFDSIDGAVRCAITIQQQIPDYDRDQSPDRAIRFRVGINIGDVIADGTDLHGDGVNIAARLQSECPPGGICVSRAVRDHVHRSLDLAFEELGTLNLKNIARPVEGFVLRLQDAATTTPGSVERFLKQGVSEALTPLDKPSIAVLAFDDMGGDPDQEYFSDGVADDIISELSRSRSLFVIARNSSFTYKGRAVDVKQVARELGVRYVLKGSVRRSGGRVRISAQLIDAETGVHLWAERYDPDIADIFAVQSEIAAAVTTAIAPKVADAEQQRAIRRPPASLDAWAAYQRGLWHLSLGNADDNATAETFFREAIDLNPTFSSGYTGLAFAVDLSGVAFDRRDVAEARGMAEALARRAIAFDDGDAEAHSCFSGCLVGRGDHQGAQAEAERALAISPNLAGAYGALGMALLFSGRPKEAVPLIEECLRRDPRGPERALSLGQLAIAHYFSRDYAGAVEAAHRAIRSSPNLDPSYYRWLAAALGQLGRATEAREALSNAATFGKADFNMRVRNRAPWMRRDDHAHMLEGLRKAGWDE